MKRHLVATVTLLGLLSTAANADVIKGFTEHWYTETGSGLTLPFRLRKPAGYDADLDREYPLILFLHGAGSRGTNNTGQLSNTTVINNLISHADKDEYAALILVPQTDSSWLTYGDDLSDSTRLTMAALELVTEYFRVDTTRLYVTGLSLGGGGTWDVIGKRPGYFAAAMPVCGYGDVSKAPNMVNQPIWAFHAVDDGSVPVESTREMINAVRDAGGDPLYTEYTSGGHSIWGKVYSNDEHFDWMFSQVLAVPEPATVGLLIGGLLVSLGRRRRVG